jgi:hypothetical protein
MQKIPMEYRNIVKRMIARVDGLDTTITSKDVAREICKEMERPIDPMITFTSYELLRNALLNPPEGFEVFREDEGLHFSIKVRRSHQ